MTLNPNKVERFTRQFHEKYEEESELDEIVDVISYTDEYDGLDYFKIGKRVGLPVNIIEDTVDPITIISSFVRNLTIGERNFVLRQLNQHAEEGDIDTIPIEEVSRNSVESWATQIENPNRLYLPLDQDYYSETDLWTLESELNIKVDWIPLKHNINYGFLFDRSKVHLVQKWFNEMESPGFSHVSKFDRFSINRPMGLFYGGETFTAQDQDPKYQKQVDFLYQTVLSELLISDEVVVRLEPEKELSSE